MKKQINDLLLKMQNGENCIGSTANELLNLYNDCITKGKLPLWTNKDIDGAYLMGCINVGGLEDLEEELKWLKELGLKPHQVIGKIRGKSVN